MQTKVIWKYTLATLDKNPTPVSMPALAEILHCDMKNAYPTLWALVNPDVDVMQERSILMLETGHETPSNRNLRHISTVLDGPFVWHFFEVL